ncbi:unnamed protein product [Thelazia callipaeda]|uniref:Uncharacterized protein n=1 Tax=Thelazia callipaeda TaxID=103827 RepID=A0A0N5D1W8_THECL|nr:unnamed protein product [Thelazia callipaeda]
MAALSQRCLRTNAFHSIVNKQTDVHAGNAGREREEESERDPCYMADHQQGGEDVVRSDVWWVSSGLEWKWRVVGDGELEPELGLGRKCSNNWVASQAASKVAGHFEKAVKCNSVFDFVY